MVNMAFREIAITISFLVRRNQVTCLRPSKSSSARSPSKLFLAKSQIVAFALMEGHPPLRSEALDFGQRKHRAEERFPTKSWNAGFVISRRAVRALCR